MIQWLSKLVAFDTTSRNSNLSLIDVIQDWCKQYQIISRLTYDPKEPKANLLITLPAADGNIKGGLVLSGHTDTVPVDGQTWETNPFEAVERDGRIYGRGTCDMKGFLAVILALMPEFSKLVLKKPIHFAFSYDEEIGCRGVPFLLADIHGMGIEPEACIVGEPTEMRPIIAHKGRQLLRCQIHGVTAHSSLTQKGCNAIEYGAQLICHLHKMAKQLRRKGPLDKSFDVPYTTLTTNLIKGGNAYNVIPELCEFAFEIRYLPHINPQHIVDKIELYIQEKLLPKMQKRHPETSVNLEIISGGHGLDTPEDEPIAKLLRSITQVRKQYKVSYSTEAGYFQRANIPTITCGPGNIKEAHSVNEFISIDQLKKCKKVISAAVKKFCC